jgi:hypothetical protein
MAKAVSCPSCYVLIVMAVYGERFRVIIPDIYR